MTIQITRLHDKADVTHASLTITNWYLWASADFNVAPSESGSNVSTDAAGLLQVPTDATSGYLLLRNSDNQMQLYNVSELQQ